MGNSIAPVVAGLVVGIAFVILFASFGVQLPSLYRSVYQGLYMVQADGTRIDITPVMPEEECPNCIVLQFFEADEYVRETGKSAVTARFLTENVTVHRGSYADIPLLLTHIGGTDSERNVAVRVVPPTGYILYPKSVAQATTEEERFEAAKAGTRLNGGIDLAQFVLATDPLVISVGSEKTINVRFVVPADMPDEVDGTFIPIMLEIQSSADQEVLHENTGIELIIAP